MSAAALPCRAEIDTTTYCIGCNNCYMDGFDSFDITSAVLYLGNGSKNPEVPPYQKLISNDLNSITLIITDDITFHSVYVLV